MSQESTVSHFSTARPVAVLMVFLAAVVFGWLSYGRLAVTLMPEMTYPTLTVRTEYPGAAPEEVENDISRPIEEAVGVIAGLRKLSSISRAGVSDVVLEFAWDTRMPEATQDVLEKLDLVFLPDEAKRPLLLHYDPSLDPVLELSLVGTGDRFAGEQGLRRLRRLADLRVKKDLEPIKGVAAVRIRGGLEEEIHVLLDESALRRVNLPIQTVIDRIQQENINVAGGTLKEGRIEYLVRTLNEFETIEQIGETIVAQFEGRPVRVADLGRVERAHKEREIVTRVDGGESVQIEIYKEGDANIVALAKRVKATLGSFDPEQAAADSAGAASGPGRGRSMGGGGLVERLYRDEGASLKLVADRSLFIESSIREVRNTAMLGGLLAVIVLFLFLRNFKSTAIIAVSIPMSLLITFAPLSLLDVSLNIMSLGGLALGIGMLVDSSIVVLESIYRCREEGDGVLAAASRGVMEVRAAVWASTLTTIAVFFPMVFVEGIAGQAFGDLGVAVVVSLLASTAVALYFIPMLASRRAPGAVSGVTLDYFESPAWVARRERLEAAPLWRRVALAPWFGAVFVATFHSHYVQRAWGELRQDWLACSTVQRLASAPYWLVQAVLLLPLPYVARLLRVCARTHVATVSRAWSDLRADWSGSSRALRGITAPWYALRAVLLPVVPYLFANDAWRAVRETFQAQPPRRQWLLVATVLPLIYLLLRWLLGALSELLGALLMGLWSLVLWVVVRLVAPFLALVFQALIYLPLRLTDRLLSAAYAVYPRLLRAALLRPALVLLIVAACLGLTWQIASSLDSELLPEVHQGEFTVEVELPVGTPLEATETIIAPIEAAILAEREHIEALLLTVGYDSAQSRRSDEGEHTATFKVLLESGSRRAATEDAVIERVRSRLGGIPDLNARIVRPVLFSAKTPIEVEVHGQELSALRQQADRVRALMAAMPELADVDTTLRSGAPEVQILYDRDRLALYGLNLRDVANLIRDKVKGFEATRFNLKDRRIPVIVRLGEGDREAVEDVAGLIVNPGGERPIPLAAVAAVSLGEGPSEVRRIDGRRVAVVGANIAEGSLSQATWKIEDALRQRLEWPAEQTFFMGGQNEEWESSRRSLFVALALSIFLVYVIMAAQFESLLHPLVIMLTIPLAFVGTVVAIKAAGLNLSIVVFLGMILLAGIVVNNAIILVDYINTLRRRGMAREEAILTAGRVRLRPILMTTGTTVLGLSPMALGLGDGAEIRTPMALAVISGLISSTLLTLIVIPTIYALVERLKDRVTGRQQIAPAREVPDTGDAEAVPS